MRKVKKRIPLDESETIQLFYTVNWEWLFRFIQDFFGIGTQNTYPTPHIEHKKEVLTGAEHLNVTLIWKDELKEHCGPLAIALQSTKLMATSSEFYKEVDNKGDTVKQAMSLVLSFQLVSATDGYSFHQLLTADYSDKNGWLIRTSNGRLFKQGKFHITVI